MLKTVKLATIFRLGFREVELDKNWIRRNTRYLQQVDVQNDEWVHLPVDSEEYQKFLEWNCGFKSVRDIQEYAVVDWTLRIIVFEFEDSVEYGDYMVTERYNTGPDRYDYETEKTATFIRLSTLEKIYAEASNV